MLRSTLGWSNVRMALECKVSTSYWMACEGGSKLFSVNLLDNIREATGIDLYVLAYCMEYDSTQLPGKLPFLLSELRTEWERQIKIMRTVQHVQPLWTQQRGGAGN